jgi:hypothetical protein
MSRESELKETEQLIKEEMKDKKGFKKLKEVTIAEDFSYMNTNEAVRWNAGNPEIGARLHENSPMWAKIIYALAFVYIIVIAISLVLLVSNGAL